MSNFTKMRPLGAGLFHADGRTDGRTDRQTDKHDVVSDRFSQSCKHAQILTKILMNKSLGSSDFVFSTRFTVTVMMDEGS